MENWEKMMYRKMMKNGTIWDLEIGEKKGEKRAKKGRKKAEKRVFLTPGPGQKKHFTPPRKLGDLYGTPTPKSTLRRVKSHPPPGGPPPFWRGEGPREKSRKSPKN